MTIQSEILLQKLPPQNIDAEQMVLGGVLIENDAIDKAKALLRTDDFYKTGHRKIWAAMLEMREKGENIDLITLADALRTGGLELVGGASYLATLVSLVPTAANIRHHAGIVSSMSQLRSIIHDASDAITKAYTLQEPNKIITDLVGSVNDARRSEHSQIVTRKELLLYGIGEAEKLFEQKGRISGLTTGIKDLDLMLSGLQKSDLVVIAARPSMGKSALAEGVAESAAAAFLREFNEAGGTGKKKHVGFISIEMGKRQLALRAISRASGVSNTKIRRGDMSNRDWDLLAQGIGEGISLPIVYEVSALDERAVEASIDKLVQQYGCELILVDYIQLMRSDEERGRNREQEVSGQSRMLKGKAKQHDIPVVALSQLNRALENRVDKRPILADLRESGAIEQDADVVLFLYREEVYKPCACPDDMDCGCGRRGRAVALVRKQRMGPCGDVDLTWHGPTTSFRDADQGRL